MSFEIPLTHNQSFRLTQMSQIWIVYHVHPEIRLKLVYLV